ncbi:MAG: chalcone isomerase family protein [Acidovorax sp.]|jgi:hypothetical protein|nr:chalcone isomerase family protein [Acidovorax sp.]
MLRSVCEEQAMYHPYQRALALASCVASCLPGLAHTAETDAAMAGKSVQVAGQHLLLNGAGISTRLMFKIYAVSLYLPDQRRTTEAVLQSNGPRRLVIRLMRDISSQDFEAAVLEKLSKDLAHADARVLEQMEALSQAIARLPAGLRRGDLLTLDWIPGTGTVIEHNQRPVVQPIQDIAFYNALLNIWLGEQPADPRLKTALLGQAPA